MRYTYHLAILGGTFDHFHKGHELLLQTAFNESEKVIIGISKPKLYEHKLLAAFIESYDERKTVIVDYLKKNDWLKRAQLLAIEDIFGNSLEESTIEVIVVTKDNLPAVRIINSKREEVGFKPLQISVVPYVKGTDGELITSERIRKGEIDRNGFAYYDLFKKSNYTLPLSLRPELQKPLGKVFFETHDVVQTFTDTSFVIAVGDIVSANLAKAGYTPAIRVIDQRNRREDIAAVSYPNALHAKNSQGTIQSKAVAAYQKALEAFFKTKESQTVVIDGEEDLLALPAILLAPLGATVLYGQYGEGVVVNKVTESLKKNIRDLLKKFQ